MATAQNAQKVVREKGQTTCVHHRGQLLILYCETCSDVLCVKCLSGLHKGHFVCDLSEVIRSKKAELRRYLDKNNRAHIKLDIDSTETEMKKTLNNFDSLCREVKSQSVKLKQAIDVKTEKVLSFCKQMEEGNIKELTSFRRELQSRLEYFDDEVQQAYTAALRDGSNLLVHDTLEEVRSKSNLPLMPILGTASFHPNTNPHSYMDRYFGSMTSSAYRPLQYTFLPKTKELSSFDLERKVSIKAISTTSGGEAWVCQSQYDCDITDYTTHYITSITLVDANGEVQEEIPWELPIMDACVSLTTQNLWICSNDSVYELDVSRKSSASILKTTPTVGGTSVTCICVTTDDHVLVGEESKITKYTKDGRAVITTQPRQSGNPLVPSPQKIAECCVTQNVAVISSYSSVVVMNQDFEEIFYVEISENQRKALNIDPYQNMRDLQYDIAGNLIICCDSYLHVSDGSGEFLKAIMIQPLLQRDYIEAASLDTDGVLWTGRKYVDHEYKYTVKRLQYCRKNVV